MTGSESTLGKRRLVRRPAEGKIAGVCAGLADYFNTDVALVRAAWVVLSIWPGAIVLGVVAYRRRRRDQETMAGFALATMYEPPPLG